MDTPAEARDGDRDLVGLRAQRVGLRYTEVPIMARTAASRGWIVTLAGLGINLALGVLYSWSVVAKTLSKPVAEGGWGWSSGQASLPYAIGVGVFALSMVFAGRAQDRFGPRIVATVGGALCGLGLIVASFATPENTLADHRSASAC